MQASDKPIDATELAAAIAESARIEAAMRPGSSQPIEQERLYRALQQEAPDLALPRCVDGRVLLALAKALDQEPQIMRNLQLAFVIQNGCACIMSAGRLVLVVPADTWRAAVQAAEQLELVTDSTGAVIGRVARSLDG